MTCTSAGNSSIYISKNTSKMDVAKEFIKFIHSREMLALMSQISSCLRPFDYELTADELAACTPYFKSVYEMWKDTENCEVAYDMQTSKLLAANSTYFADFYIMGEPFSKFHGDKNLTAQGLYEQQVSKYQATNKIWQG